jgi:hypothetical protein
MLKRFGDVSFVPTGLSSADEQGHRQAEPKSQAESCHHGGERIAPHNRQRTGSIFVDVHRWSVPLVFIAIRHCVATVVKIAAGPLRAAFSANIS